MKEPISAAVEGIIDRAVVQRLFTEVSLPLGTIYIAEGKHNLRKKLPGYNQKEMVPTLSSGRREGPAYASRMIEFVTRHWNVENAQKHSPSLQRCRKALESLRNIF